MQTYNCVVCMDSGYLAINNENPSIVKPMLEVSGSDLADYKLQKCSCKVQNKAERWKEEVNKQVVHKQLKL